jgi:hypothetical protein
MSEKLEEHGGHLRVAEDARLLAEGTFGGDDRRPLTNAADEMEKKPTASFARHLAAERQRLSRRRVPTSSSA